MRRQNSHRPLRPPLNAPAIAVAASAVAALCSCLGDSERITEDDTDLRGGQTLLGVLEHLLLHLETTIRKPAAASASRIRSAHDRRLTGLEDDAAVCMHTAASASTARIPRALRRRLRCSMVLPWRPSVAAIRPPLLSPSLTCSGSALHQLGGVRR